MAGYTDKKFESRRNNPTQPPAVTSEQVAQSKPVTIEPYRAPIPTNLPPVVTAEDRHRIAAQDRLSVNETRYKFLEKQVTNDELPLIKDVETAQIWNGGSDDSITRCLDVLEQKLSQQSKGGSQIELRLREILSRHMKRVEAQASEIEELSDNGEDLSIPHEKLTRLGKQRRTSRLLGR